jgi:hypothetical protein
MKRALLMILCLIAVAVTVIKVKVHAQDPVLNGYYTVKPWTGGNQNDAMVMANASATIPLGSFTFTASKDGGSYTDVIVGQSPFRRGHSPTTVKILVVPVIINIGGNIFDPTAANNCGGSMGHTDVANFLASPIMSPVTFDGAGGAGHGALVNGVNMGTGTYNDTHRRAEFLNAIGGPTSAYHTNYAITLAATQTINLATTAGHSAIIAGTAGNCNFLGGLEINFFDPQFQTMVATVGGDPTSFVVFLMHNVIFYDTTTSNCCILGFHGAFGSPVQTYSPTDYDTTGDFGAGIINVSVAAHEIGEWLDDPLGNNPTPAWGGIGQVGSCQGNWEVGDPLTGSNFPAILMPNGVTYNPQSTAFWGWFYAAFPDPAPIAAGGKYSMNSLGPIGPFNGPSKVCPPGGTN